MTVLETTVRALGRDLTGDPCPLSMRLLIRLIAIKPVDGLADYCRYDHHGNIPPRTTQNPSDITPLLNHTQTVLHTVAEPKTI